MPATLDPAREEAELREYLGKDFDLQRLQGSWALLDEEYAAIGDEQAFYRTSVGYLYNLTAFAMTATKIPYLEELERLVRPGARLLDYGCGIGSDGLLLLEAGYRVEFADFDNPSVEYLRWRLARRGLHAPVHDLTQSVPDGFDGAYAFDVIEHVEDPFAFLEAMERRAALVCVNFLEPEPGDQDLHHDLPIRELVDHAAARDLQRYAVLHRRSHLVLYGPAPVSLPRRALNRLRVRATRRGTRTRSATRPA